MNFTRSLFRASLALILVGTLSACVIPNEGNYAIVKNWDNTYQDKVSTGIEVTVLDSAVEVYGRERLLQILDVRPKDSENVMLQDLDLAITYRTNPDKAVEFLRKRSDITSPEDMANGIYVVGETYLHKDAKSVIGETIRKFKSEDVLNTKRKVEEQFRVDLQEEVNTLYGKEVFFIDEVKIANVIVAPSIEERIQAVALINSERIRAEAVSRVLDVRKDIQTKEMTVIRDVADGSGLTVDQVLEARRLDILRDMPAGAATVVVNSERQ